MVYETEDVRYEEEFIVNSRGMKLFTCRWLPVNCEPKALIFLCHGYAMECSISMKGSGTRLARAGFAVYGMDYEGHGKSSGLQGFVPSFDDVVTDCSDHYTSISERKENKNKLRVLMGESMGGAVALLLHRKKPTYWNGAILVAPMCKIADEMKPNPVVVNLLSKLSRLIPTWKIIPTQDIIDAAFRDPQVRSEIRSNPYCYKGRPRLLTGKQLLTVSLDLEQRLQEVSLPFLIVHGGDDKVTDPSVSKLLYESAASTDKSFKLYPGMWHSLTYGELPENIDTVFSDVTAWLDERVAAARNSALELERKIGNDDFELLKGNSSSSKQDLNIEN
ncbi:acylglycerol lipase [Sarracenia purpurea var. burkii]